jgi:hypothetical protein
MRSVDTAAHVFKTYDNRSDNNNFNGVGHVEYLKKETNELGNVFRLENF